MGLATVGTEVQRTWRARGGAWALRVGFLVVWGLLGWWLCRHVAAVLGAYLPWNPPDGPGALLYVIFYGPSYVLSCLGGYTLAIVWSLHWLLYCLDVCGWRGASAPEVSDQEGGYY